MSKRDLIRRIDLRPTAGSIRAPVYGASATSNFDDEQLVRRDGTHWLYSTAKWLWSAGAEVTGTFRSWGSGIVQVFGTLFAGRQEGPRVGIFERTNEDSVASFGMEAVGLDNVPFFGVGGLDSGDRDDTWGTLGYEGFPRIHLETVTGYERKLPLVDVAVLNGAIPGSQIDTHTLTIPVVDSLAGLTFSEGQLFLLRLGADSGALYAWTRWGPEPQGGYHRAGPHNHQTFDEGDTLSLAAAMTDVAITSPTAYDTLYYDAPNSRWANGAREAVYVGMADAGGYFATDQVEWGMQYLASWLLDVAGRVP